MIASKHVLKLDRTPTMWRALAHRNFRLFFFGQGVSVMGSWMQQVAMMWLVYRLSNSPLLLGLMGFCAQIPAALVTPVAGVLLDRWDLRRTLLITQSLAMTQAFVLTALTFSGAISVWQIIPLSILLGLIDAFDVPARQSFVSRMVAEQADLANAVALNSTMFNAARLVGPAIAGFVIGWLGEWPCFLLNALSYLAVLASLLAMRIQHHARPSRRVGIVAELKEGFAYVSGSTPIRMLLLLLATVSMMSMPLTVLMPLVSSKVLHGGPDTLGLLTACCGVGALSASLSLAARRSVVGLSTLIAWMAGAFGLGLIALALSRTLWLSELVMLGTGFAMVAEMAATNIVLQTIVDEDKRGRVMGFYSMAFLATAPLGSLLAGTLATVVGTLATIMLFGLVCVGGSLLFASRLPALRRGVRPIYIRVGLLPDPAAATARDLADESLAAMPFEAEVEVAVDRAAA